MKEVLAAIDAPHFFCGIVLQNDKVIEAAPIVGYMKRGKWSRASACATTARTKAGRSRSCGRWIVNESRRHASYPGIQVF